MKMKYYLLIPFLFVSGQALSETVRAYIQGSTFIVSATNNSDVGLNCNETHTLSYTQFGEPKTYNSSSNFAIPKQANNMNVIIHQTTWDATTLKIDSFNYQCN